MARYIDADALIKSAENKRLVIDTAKTTVAEALRIQGKAIREAIENAPTADAVEVKHGEWITLEAEIGLYSCSLCGHNILRAKCNYCPNCGAKMDGVIKC